MPTKKLDQLAKQIILKGFVPVILIILGIVAIQYYLYAKNELQNNRINLTNIAKNLSSQIEGSNQFAVGLAQTMAQAQTNGLFGDRMGSSQYAKDVLSSHTSLTGAYFGYEQNADQSDDLYLNKTQDQPISRGLDQFGRFLPYWHRDANQQNAITLAPLTDMEHSLYYQGVKQRFAKQKIADYFVTEPYKYQGKLIVEQVFPIVIKGEFKGIAGVDRALNDLVSLLKTESKHYAVDVFLISEQGQFISTTIKQNNELLTLPVAQTPYLDLFAPPVLNHNIDWFVKAIDPFEQKEYFYSAAKVTTGNWLLIVRKSEALVTGIIWQTAAVLLILSLFGLIISGWLIRRVLSKTSDRIKLALSTANKLAKGEIPDFEGLHNAKNSDEISALLHAFNDVVKHYENIKLACENMAQGDFSIRLTEKSTKDVLSRSLNSLAEKLKSTEQDMLEAMHQVESANLSKSQFLANMSHEIRTPMNAVLGMSRLCLNTQLNVQQKDYLEKIHSSGRMLLNIINDILDFSKIESGKLELEKTPFSLESIFDDLSSVSMEMAHQKGLELLFNVPYAPVKFTGDPLRIGQILTNLTSNAIKFSNSGEVVIDVKTTKKDSTHSILTFKISDQGIGISQAQQQKLFSAFTQAENSTTRNYGGTGLGLVICKNLVEMMGGKIDISSDLGVGTTVSFSIEFERFENISGGFERIVPESLKDLRILVVDDSETARYIMRQQLARLCLSCDVVKSGDEALELLEKHAKTKPYQLVLMDWKMPGMDGLQTVRLIRQNPNLPEATTILMVTAYYGEEGKGLFKKEGLNHFLKKPVSDADLFNIILNCFTDNSVNDLAIDEKWQLSNNTQLQGAHVLIAEDNFINQQITAEYLEQIGITYDIAKNGKEAVALVKKNQYQAVLMDLQMPVMGGLEATEIIRTLPDSEFIPIIAMTANAMEQHKKACLDAGMDTHLAKPIDVEELYATLKQYIKLQPITNKIPIQENKAFQLPDNRVKLTYIDFNLAMSHSKNDLPSVIKLMTIFKNTHASELTQLEEAIDTNTHTDTSSIAHSIAGVADYIGANNLANLARAYDNFDGEIGSESHRESLQKLFTELKGVSQDLDLLLEAYTLHPNEFGAEKTAEVQPSSKQNSAALTTFSPIQNPLFDSTQIQQILIVDDDPINIAILQDLLKTQYHLSFAENGQQALDKVAENMPDLILLDIHMPVMDGYTTCKILKQTDKHADIPIMFITGKNNADEAKCLKLGAVDFISKPFVKEIVKARVATQMALKHKSDLLLAKGLTDELTQVANRRAYNERIMDELARAKRDKKSISLLMIDLDKFKLYNDNYGHLAGDQCLQKIASFLALHLKRPADFIARIGGEEFAVILPDTSLDGAHDIALRLKNSVESLALEHALSKHNVMTISIGVTTAKFANLQNVAAVTADELMIQADIGLYKAKKAGGNQINGDIYTPA